MTQILTLSLTLNQIIQTWENINFGFPTKQKPLIYRQNHWSTASIHSSFQNTWEIKHKLSCRKLKVINWIFSVYLSNGHYSFSRSLVSTIVPSQSDMYIQVTSILGIKKTGNSGEAQVMWEEGSQCIIHLLINAGYWNSGSSKWTQDQSPSIPPGWLIRLVTDEHQTHQLQKHWHIVRTGC